MLVAPSVERAQVERVRLAPRPETWRGTRPPHLSDVSLGVGQDNRVQGSQEWLLPTGAGQFAPSSSTCRTYQRTTRTITPPSARAEPAIASRASSSACAGTCRSPRRLSRRWRVPGLRQTSTDHSLALARLRDGYASAGCDLVARQSERRTGEMARTVRMTSPLCLVCSFHSMRRSDPGSTRRPPRRRDSRHRSEALESREVPAP